MDIQSGQIICYSVYAIIAFVDNHFKIIARISSDNIIRGIYTGRIIETPEMKLYKAVRLFNSESDYQHYDYVPENVVIIADNRGECHE